MARRWRKLALWATAGVIAACSGPEGPGTGGGGASTTDDGGKITTDSAGADTSGTTGKDADAAQGDAGPIAVTEDFWLLYFRFNRLQGAAANEHDWVLTDWQNPNANKNAGVFGIGQSPLDATKPALKLTDYAFKQAAGYNCNHGCQVSPDLKYIAVAKGPPKSDGYEYALGTLNDDLQVFIGKFGELKKVAHLAFAGQYLFYSTQANCLGTGKCQYDVHRRGPLGSADAEDVVLLKMAPDNDKDVTENDTTYTGYFHVSDDGSTLVFLTPTIRSTKVWAWRDGKLSKLDYICDNKVDEETCVGTGSEYHDSDPVAISPDGKTVVLFSIVDRYLRVRRFDLGVEDGNHFQNLVTVPPGKKYREAACSVLKPGQHVQVKHRPQFSADGKLVYFVGYSKCGGDGDKPWTDIMALPVAKIGPNLKPDDPNDWIRVTHNPRDNSTKNKVISDFAMSPQKQVFIVSGTATWDSSGVLIPDGQKRAMEDIEMYTIAVGTEDWVPVTNELKYAATAPTAVVPLPGK